MDGKMPSIYHLGLELYIALATNGCLGLQTEEKLRTITPDDTGDT